MYSHFQLGKKYIHYLFTAANAKGHGMHSPFVFELITKVFIDKFPYPAYAQVEQLRKKLIADKRIIKVEDHGAGSSMGGDSSRKIGDIVRNAAKPAKFGQLLYRIAAYYQPATIIEMGSSLGITTAYLSLARSSAHVYTMEGSGSIAAIARENFKSLGLQNIEMIEGNFDDTLPALLTKIDVVDMVFVDGNHRKEPTLAYFEQLLERVHPNSIIIFDDIHWSEEMEEAWELIRAHPRVRCAIDLFFVGLVFFRQEFIEKQDFTIRF